MQQQEAAQFSDLAIELFPAHGIDLDIDFPNTDYFQMLIERNGSLEGFHGSLFSFCVC